MDQEIHLRLTEKERELFLMMQGMAAAVAMQGGDKQLIRAVVRLINKINAGNPGFIPYTVPED